MSDWQSEHDVELAEMYAGADGGQGYVKALIADAFTRMGERVVQPYLDGKQTLDAVLTKLETIAQPEPSPGQIFSHEYKQLLADLCRRQYSNEPETLNRLLAQIESD